MASLRRVRKNFRTEVLRLIESGQGNWENLMSLATEYFGKDVGFDVVLKAYYQVEVSNAVSHLRNEGRIETVGKQWKQVADLDDSDVTVILTRRFKRIRGELKSQVRLAHEKQRVDEAIKASQALGVMSTMFPDGERLPQEISEQVELVR